MVCGQFLRKDVNKYFYPFLFETMIDARANGKTNKNNASFTGDDRIGRREEEEEEEESEWNNDCCECMFE